MQVKQKVSKILHKITQRLFGSRILTSQEILRCNAGTIFLEPLILEL